MAKTKTKRKQWTPEEKAEIARRLLGGKESVEAIFRSTGMARSNLFLIKKQAKAGLLGGPQGGPPPGKVDTKAEAARSPQTSGDAFEAAAEELRRLRKFRDGVLALVKDL